MTHEVFVFGDSHWRLGFPFTNHDGPGVVHEERGIATFDTTANELSGATMWGLHKELTTHMARQRILRTIDERGGVDNVLLIFGEVDVRYHWNRYYRDDRLYRPAIWELLLKYRQFIDQELLPVPGRVDRVRNKVFVYYGWRYDPIQPEQQDRRRIGTGRQLLQLHREIEELIGIALECDDRIVPILPVFNLEHGLEHEDGSGRIAQRYRDQDGVHPMPETIYYDFVLPAMEAALGRADG